MSDNLVECRGLSFGYGQRIVLDDISFTVPQGKVTAIMGASGGGKTTILRLIGGQVRSQKGALLFEGKDVGQLDRHGLYAARRRMGMAARARIEREFSLDSMVQSFDQLYRRLLERP